MFWKSWVRNLISRRGYHSYTGKEFEHWVDKYSKGKEGCSGIRTSVSKEPCLARQTWRIENAIERILYRGAFTEKKMLVIQNPYNFAPLSALILFVTDKPCSVRVQVEGYDAFTYVSEEASHHRLPVLGMGAGKENRICLTLLDGDTVLLKKEIRLVAGPLPEELSDSVRVDKTNGEGRDPILVFGGDTKFPYAFDEKGEICFYMKKRTRSYGLYPLSGGRFILLAPNIDAPSFANPHAVIAYEMDFMGRVFREYLVMDGIHHDGCEMAPGGNFLTVSSSMEEYVEDSIIEISRQTGEVVKRLVLDQIMGGHPYVDTHDWAHINTVSYQKEEGTILICARNLHSVIKIDWQSQEVLWIFCDPDFWAGTPWQEKVLEPEGKVPFCYQAHAAYFLEEESVPGRRRMIIYDNHWHKRRPVKSFDGDKRSYVRIYEIDERENKVRHIRSYGTEKSRIRSNGLVTDGHVFLMSGCLVKQKDGMAGLIEERDRDTGETLNEYHIRREFYRAYLLFPDYVQLQRAVSTPFQKILGVCPGLFVWEEEKERESLPVKKFQAKFYEDYLLLYQTDHEIEKVFFRGVNHGYMQDFSHTEQTLPHIFGGFKYWIVCQTAEAAPDYYEVLVRAGGELYRTDIWFNKS